MEIRFSHNPYNLFNPATGLYGSMLEIGCSRIITCIFMFHGKLFSILLTLALQKGILLAMCETMSSIW